jgi:hypothetical protein
MLCDIEHEYFMNIFNNKNSNETLENKNKKQNQNMILNLLMQVNIHFI